MVALLVLASLLALGATACGNKSEKELAAEALQAGLTAHAAGRLEEAVNDYNEVLANDPRNKFAYYNLGLIAQTQGEAASAENNYRITLSIDPDYVPALYNLAILRTDAGDDTEAIQLYRHAIEVDPADAPSHLNLGFLLIDAGATEEGQTELDTAVQLDPTLADRIPEGPQEPGGTEPASDGKPSATPSGSS